LFRLQDKDYTGDILLPHLINPGRKKLIGFLEEKTSYNADKLLERVSGSWMFEEKIILLIKKKKYDEAVEIFVENQQFEEAEEFCNQRPQLSLMTILWQIYVKKYIDTKSQYDQLNDDPVGNHEKLRQTLKQKDLYKYQALELMKKYCATNQLDPQTLLENIPNDWEVNSKAHNVTQYLMKMFDHQLTLTENTKISASLSEQEQVNAQIEADKLKQSYLVIGDDSMCKVCNRKLTYKFVRIYPNGGVYHTLCAKEPHECPITR
jgi:vacuolar protein sorting-associated protein 3